MQVAEPSFLIHYGWRGTLTSEITAGANPTFLIHYGWRGTDIFRLLVELGDQFLIHYGWRGTAFSSSSRAIFTSVSNPLRLEGDARVLVQRKLIEQGF